VALLAELTRRMHASRCGAIFFGVDLARGESGHCNIQALARTGHRLERRWPPLVCHADAGPGERRRGGLGPPLADRLPVCREHGARVSAIQPWRVFSVQGLLERDEADACLLIGSETWTGCRRAQWLTCGGFPRWSSTRRASIRPSPRPSDSNRDPGNPSGGDGVSNGRRAGAAAPVLPTQYPSDQQILDDIQDRHRMPTRPAVGAQSSQRTRSSTDCTDYTD
jgi:hypothetical protein